MGKIVHRPRKSQVEHSHIPSWQLQSKNIQHLLLQLLIPKDLHYPLDRNLCLPLLVLISFDQNEKWATQEQNVEPAQIMLLKVSGGPDDKGEDGVKVHYMLHQTQEEPWHTAKCWRGCHQRMLYPTQMLLCHSIQHMINSNKDMILSFVIFWGIFFDFMSLFCITLPFH